MRCRAEFPQAEGDDTCGDRVERGTLTAELRSENRNEDDQAERCKETKTDHLLTVMYVTDDSNTAAPIKAEEIQTAHLAGAVILNRVMLFAKKSCGELIKMGMKQGLFTQNDADMMVERINKEIEKLG